MYAIKIAYLNGLKTKWVQTKILKWSPKKFDFTLQQFFWILKTHKHLEWISFYTKQTDFNI